MFDFFSDIVSFFKLCMIACFLLAFTFMVLVSLPRSPLREAFIQALLWGLALAGCVLAVSPIDFIPILPFDNMLAGFTGIFSAGVAVMQKIRQRREERELALWQARMRVSASYPVPQKTLLVTSSKERTSDEDATE